MGRRDYLGRETHCPVCGKYFLVAPMNVYNLPNRKGGLSHYCSYNCFRTEQKKREKKKPYDMEYEPIRRRRCVKTDVN